MTSASNYSDPAAAAPERPERPPQTAPVADVDRLPHRAPPELENGYLLHGRRPEPGQVRVIAGQTALRQLQAHSKSDLESEVGGALLGHAYRYREETYVEIKAALPARTDDHGPNHFTFNADAWSHLHRDRASRHPELDIVGWFHTHPGLGVFYSADDVVVHSAAFVMPWHVGLVVDPASDEAGLFGWIAQEAKESNARTIAPLAGFYEQLDEGDDSVFPWRFVRAAVWEQTYEEYLHQQRKRPATTNGVQMAPQALQALPPINPWLGVLLGGLGLVLALGVLFGGLLPVLRQARALEDVVVALAEEEMARANSAGLAECTDPRLRIYAPLAGRPVAAGEAVQVVGTADHEDAVYYRLEMRPAGVENWWLLEEFRGDVATAPLTEWDTLVYSPGEYQLRLLALDRQKEPLAGTSGCTITFEMR